MYLIYSRPLFISFINYNNVATEFFRSLPLHYWGLSKASDQRAPASSGGLPDDAIDFLIYLYINFYFSSHPLAPLAMHLFITLILFRSHQFIIFLFLFCRQTISTVSFEFVFLFLDRYLSLSPVLINTDERDRLRSRIRETKFRRYS